MPTASTLKSTGGTHKSKAPPISTMPVTSDKTPTSPVNEGVVRSS